MNTMQTIEDLYLRFGTPPLTNFARKDLAEDDPYRMAAFALAVRDGAAVLIRRTPIAEYPGIENHWWIPGGACELPEQLDQTAARELLEEAGLDVRIDKLLLSYRNPEHPWLCVFFLATVVAGEVSASDDPDRITAEARAFQPGELTLDDLWEDTDKILLTESGFVQGAVDELLAKHRFRRSVV